MCDEASEISLAKEGVFVPLFFMADITSDLMRAIEKNLEELRREGEEKKPLEEMGSNPKKEGRGGNKRGKVRGGRLGKS